MLKTVYKKVKIFLWLHKPLKYWKKHDSQERYFVNDQGLVVYLKRTCRDNISPRNIALSFPLFYPRLEQALHKHQEQHSWHAGNIFVRKRCIKIPKDAILCSRVVSDVQWNLSQYSGNQQQESKEHGVFLSEGSPACLSIIQCWQNILKGL